ncbi:MAG: cell division protein ZapA [Clostridiales bacterium]|nr:cell division protein ZapA [Clostridiales bacterium]MCD7760255.1 cell division protein ZapA [Clostridiales bacterium]
MKEKMNVTIAGSTYTLVTTDDPAHVEQVAAQVDQMMTSVIQQAKVSALDAAVLTAINAVDSAVREQQTSQGLRDQMKDNLEENRKLRQELADARREITRLKKNPRSSASN